MTTDVPRLTPERRAEIERQQRAFPAGPYMPTDSLIVNFWRATRHDVPDLLRELAAVEAERDRLRRALADLVVGSGHWDRQIDALEDTAVEALCHQWGYGAVMDAASRLWARRDPGGSFVVGACRVFARRALQLLQELNRDQP